MEFKRKELGLRRKGLRLRKKGWSLEEFEMEKGMGLNSMGKWITYKSLTFRWSKFYFLEWVYVMA